jgi:hypothetical protein
MKKDKSTKNPEKKRDQRVYPKKCEDFALKLFGLGFIGKAEVNEMVDELVKKKKKITKQV